MDSLSLVTVIIGMIEMSSGQYCDANGWICTSSNAALQQAPTFIQAGTCICLTQSASPVSPTEYVQACSTAGGFPMDIRSDLENKIVAGFVDKVTTEMKETVYPAWIGLMKNAEGIDIWNDQCTNASPSAYANYDGGSKSSTPGAAYSMISGGTWKGNTADKTAEVSHGICRKDTTPCGRELCKSGSTCTPNGNCVTCACPAGYGGQFCDKPGEPGATGGAIEQTSPTPPPLPSCSNTTGDAYPNCMPDTIEVGCDEFTELPEGEGCTPVTTTAQTDAPVIVEVNVAAIGQTSVLGAVQKAPPPTDCTEVQYPDTIETKCDRKKEPATDQPKPAGCQGSWIRCNFFWVILGGFLFGIFLICVCGLCCDNERCDCIQRQRDQVQPMN